MKLLFVDFQHPPQPNANGNCVETLRCRLKARGVASDVLTFCLEGRLPLQRQDQAGMVYISSTWAKWMTAGRGSGKAGWQIALRVPAVLLTRIAHRIISGPYTSREKSFSWRACGKFRKKLEQICQQNKYDWVVAVSSPYCMHEIVCKADLSGSHLALYYLDPYSAHTLFALENYDQRMREELITVGKAHAVFVPLEHELDWRSSPLSQYINKVRFLPYPNLWPRREKIAAPQIFMDPTEINLVYLGALHDEVRHPQAMLALFAEMLVLEPRLRLFVVGYKSGTQVKAQLAKAQQHLGDRLVCENAVTFPQAIDLIEQADCAVNLGNWMKNQMPSKLLDYIAAGKPVLNISHNRPCNTAPYIERYPWALQCYEDELERKEERQKQAQSAVDFVLAHYGKQQIGRAHV